MINRQFTPIFNAPFFRDTYLRSGWIPMYPYGESIVIGDVFQIHNAKILPLVNIAQLDLQNVEQLTDSISLRMEDWPVAHGCTQINNNIFSEEAGPEFNEYRQQLYRFHEPGAYLFAGNLSQGRFLLNWHKLAEELIVKLTQSKFSFQQAWVVTAVAQVSQWGLAIAATPDAELQLVAQTDSDSCGFLNETCRITGSSHLSTYQHSHSQPLYFFKAKKLVLSDKKHDEYLTQLLRENGNMASYYAQNWLHSNLLNFTTSNELNISTCLEFFRWQDANLDDVVRLCGGVI